MPFRLDEHASSQSMLVDIARGHFSNVTPVNLFGFNRDIGTTYETIFNDGGGAYSFPSSALQMSLVSSDAADTMGVTLIGLDASYNQLIETVTLSGLTPVTTTNNFLRINQAVITAGNNVGNITISNGGTTYAYIEAGLGVHQTAVYSVPANCKLYITSVAFSSGTVNPNKYLFGRAVTHKEGRTLRFWESTWAVGFMQFSVPVPFVVEEKTDFQIQAKSSSSENEIGCYINGYLIEDE